MRDSGGFSLVEVLVGAGVLAVLALGFSQMMLNQQKETRSLSEKLAVLDFQGLLGKIMADGSLCRFELVDPANPMNSKWFNDPSPSPITDAISLPVLRAAAGSTQIFAQTSVTKVGRTLTVSGIAVRKITRLAPQKYSAELQIGVQGGVRPLNPAVSSVVLRTDGGAARGPGRETITDCSLQGAGVTGVNRYYTAITSPTSLSVAGAWTNLISMTETFDGSTPTTIHFKASFQNGYYSNYNLRLLVNGAEVDKILRVNTYGDGATWSWPTAVLSHQQTLTGPVAIVVQYFRTSGTVLSTDGSLPIKLMTW